jgi:cellulose synthase/poly-beta-1,6-N-acetylglucosamine synthase-like glycosyltransferase
LYWYPANFTFLQLLVLFAALVVTALVSIYAFNVWGLIFLSTRKTKPIDPPNVGSWPRVSVHLPLYNEELVARRLFEACVNLDYPKDKLEILAIDDSSDGTTKIAHQFEVENPGLVRVIHRDVRSGFKGGALQAALRSSSSDLVAYFDADYVPPRDFLKKMIPYLYMDGSQMAYVQARWGYLNGEFSWFAKGYSLALDMYSFVDQRARSSTNLLAHFSGSCGVFRRQALESVGGWSSETIVEDLELSIRLHLGGWRYFYLPQVVCPGEVPPSFNDMTNQQFRWAYGFSQCFRKQTTAIFRSKRLNRFQKAEALMHLEMYFISPLSALGILVGILYLLFIPPFFWLSGFWNYPATAIMFLLSAVTMSAPIVSAGIALSETPNAKVSRSRRLLHLGYLGILSALLIPATTKGVLQGFVGRKPEFRKTTRLGR